MLNSLIQLTAPLRSARALRRQGRTDFVVLKQLLLADTTLSSKLRKLSGSSTSPPSRDTATLTKGDDGIEQLLIDLIVKRPSPDVVNVSLHCLQNMCMASKSAKRVLETRPAGGVRAITILLHDQVCVDGCAGVLANIACHGSVFVDVSRKLKRCRRCSTASRSATGARPLHPISQSSRTSPTRRTASPVSAHHVRCCGTESLRWCLNPVRKHRLDKARGRARPRHRKLAIPMISLQMFGG